MGMEYKQLMYEQHNNSFALSLHLVPFCNHANGASYVGRQNRESPNTIDWITELSLILQI